MKHADENQTARANKLIIWINLIFHDSFIEVNYSSSVRTSLVSLQRASKTLQNTKHVHFTRGCTNYNTHLTLIPPTTSPRYHLFLFYPFYFFPSSSSRSSLYMIKIGLRRLWSWAIGFFFLCLSLFRITFRSLSRDTSSLSQSAICLSFS